MTYILITARKEGDSFSENLGNDKAKAIAAAKAEWDHLSLADKQNSAEFYLAEFAEAYEENDNGEWPEPEAIVMQRSWTYRVLPEYFDEWGIGYGESVKVTYGQIRDRALDLGVSFDELATQVVPE